MRSTPFLCSTSATVNNTFEDFVPACMNDPAKGNITLSLRRAHSLVVRGFRTPRRVWRNCADVPGFVFFVFVFVFIQRAINLKCLCDRPVDRDQPIGTLRVRDFNSFNFMRQRLRQLAAIGT